MPRPWLRLSRRQFMGFGAVLVILNLTLTWVIRPLIESDAAQLAFTFLVLVPLGLFTFYVLFTWALNWDKEHPREYK